MSINRNVLVVREAIAKVVFMLAGRKIRVTQQGSRAFIEYHPTKGNVIRVNIPYLPDDATDELLYATQGFLDHEIGHVLETDPQIVIKAKALGVGSMHNLIEDTFIERQMEKRFAGCAYNLDNTRRFFTENVLLKNIAEHPEDMVNILIMPMMRAFAGQSTFKNFMSDKWHHVEHAVKALGPDMPDMIKNCKSSQDCLDVALEIHKRMKKAKEETEKLQQEQESQPKPEKADKAEKGDKGEGKPEKEESGEGEPEQGDAPDFSGKEKSKKDKPAKDKKGEKDKKGDSKGEDDVDMEESGPGKPEKEGKEGGEEKGGKPEKKAGDEKPENSDSGDGGEPVEEEGDRSDGAGDESGNDEGQGDPGQDEEAGDSTDGAGEPADGNPQDGTGEGQEPSDEKGKTPGGGKPGDSDELTLPDDVAPDDDDVLFVEVDEAAGGGPGVNDLKNMNVQIAKILECDALDFDEEMAKAISELAKKQGFGSEYLPFTRDYDVIEPVEVPDGMSDDAVTKLSDAVDHMVAPMQKDIERIVAARSAAIWVGGFKRGKLHGASLARTSTGREDIFRKRQVNLTKDVAVTNLVDMSGSMSGSLSRRFGYTTAGGSSKIQIATQAAYGVASVLDRMNIVNEVLAFTTGEMPREGLMNLQKEYTGKASTRRFSREDTIYMPIIKTFAERMTPTIKRRFAYMQRPGKMSCNIDGECVQIAGQRLAQRRETRKILFVWSDGLPSANGVEEEMRWHLREVVATLPKHGVEVIGIGICSDAVEEFYPKHIVLKDTNDLPIAVMGELKKVMVA